MRRGGGGVKVEDSMLAFDLIRKAGGAWLLYSVIERAPTGEMHYSSRDSPQETVYSPARLSHCVNVAYLNGVRVLSRFVAS